MHIDFKRHVDSGPDQTAHWLRECFDAAGILSLNLMGSPGSGKTALLGRTLRALPPDTGVRVLTGDIQPHLDAELLAASGFPVRAISTLGACHLEAPMIERALAGWGDPSFELLFVENVGDLICPATWDLGEESKVAMVSASEGDDKPKRYPSVFSRSELLIISKIDLLPYVDFDVDECARFAGEVNPDIEVIELSVKTGKGFDDWMRWLDVRRSERKADCAARADSEQLVGS